MISNGNKYDNKNDLLASEKRKQNGVITDLFSRKKDDLEFLGVENGKTNFFSKR